MAPSSSTIFFLALLLANAASKRGGQLASEKISVSFMDTGKFFASHEEGTSRMDVLRSPVQERSTEERQNVAAETRRIIAKAASERTDAADVDENGRVKPPHVEDTVTDWEDLFHFLESQNSSDDSNEARKQITEKISDPSYRLHEFYGHCLLAFPELKVFFVKPFESLDPTGTEYQRTMSTVFVFFWLLRAFILPEPYNEIMKRSFCFGVSPENWDSPAKATELQEDFLQQFPWVEVQDFFVRSGILRSVEGHLEINEEFAFGMIALSSFHDMFKDVEKFLGSPEHASKVMPFWPGGGNHDDALGLVLARGVESIPSFKYIASSYPMVGTYIEFTQSGFNMGQFLQAEAPPKPLLTTLRNRLIAQGSDIRWSLFYFYVIHWLTDLAGAFGLPLSGVPFFVYKIGPTLMKKSWLPAISSLSELTIGDSTEDQVYLSYLSSIFLDHSSGSKELSVAEKRLYVMAQTNGDAVLEAFRSLAPELQMSLRKHLNVPAESKPAILPYHLPAMLQNTAKLTRTPDHLHFTLVIAAITFIEVERMRTPHEQQVEVKFSHLVTRQFAKSDFGLSEADDPNTAQGILSERLQVTFADHFISVTLK